ncbi:MAG: translocation/assembly module TamB domain-containing protein [Bacteroidaceae bacterium]|nr:translocation/assembly module TamB domain-containing protein [Bacteroidaceae bacterium]
MKRALKYILRTLLALVLLIIMLIASLYLPPVQRWAVNRLTAYIEEQTGLEVSIGSVHLSPLLDLSLGQVHIAKPPTDVIDVEHALVDLDLTRLLTLHVGVEAIELSDGSIHTTDLIETLAMDGDIGNLRIVADDIDLRKKTVNVKEASLDGCVLDMKLREAAEEDTTESAPLDWQIDVEKLKINQSKIALQLPNDAMRVNAAIRQASLDSGDISLSKGIYRVGKVSLSADSLSYDIPGSNPVKGLDVNHLAFRDAELALDKLSYDQNTSALNVQLKRLAFKEKSGFQLDNLAVNLSLDSKHLTARGLDLKTPHSSASGNLDLDWNAFSPKERGQLKADLQASLGHQDVLCLAEAYMPKDLAKCYPSQPLNIDLFATGNIDDLSLQTCNVMMPSVIDVRTTGSLQNLTDSANIGADLKWDITTMDLRCVNRYLGLNDVRFPKMTIHADTKLREASKLTADALLQEGRGRAHVVGNIDLNTMAYQGNARINNLQLHDFLPKDSLYMLTANAKFSGRGTDMLSPRTMLRAQADITHLGYASWDLDNIQADCRLDKGKAMVEMHSQNDLLCMQGCINASITDRKLKAADFNMDLSHIDLYALHLAGKPLSASMVMRVDGASDFMQTHNLKARVEAIELTTADSIIHPLDLTLDANLTPEFIDMKALAGDLSLSVSSDQGLDSLLARVNSFSGELQQQMDSLRIKQDVLRSLLPHLKMELACGQKNPIGNILRHATGYSFRDLSLHLNASPEEGLNGNGHMHSLNTGAILLDSIYWKIRQEDSGVALDARVANGPRNSIVTFMSQVHAALTETGANANMAFYDAQGKKSVDFGLALDLLADGFRAHFTPLNPIIAYRRFTLNADNFVTLTHDGHLDALVDLLADDGTGLKLYTTPNEEAQQDVSLSVNHFNVGELTQVIPFMPDLSGFLHGDFHYMQSDSTTTVSAEMLVKNMAYNGVRLGDIGLNGVYFPNADGSHYVDGIVTLDEQEILLVNGKYHEDKGKGKMDGEASFQRVPFAFLNAFMPDGPFALSGYAWGDFTVSGYTENPVLNGELKTESLHINADSYNVNLQIPDHTITVKNSRINLNRIEAYAAGKTPLVLDGNIDFSDLDRVQLDMNVRADDYQLINAPKRQGSLAYGKVFVNLGGRLWGTLSDLKMRGKLDVLGSTDVSCVLSDTPLTVDDQLADIVTFVDFNDTIPAEVVDVKRQSIDMQMNINIAETAQIHCFLSDMGNDYIDLQGGGEMTLTYDMQNDMQLWGRYTIGKGTMRYSLMAIPLNDFQIAQGSYVEFQGNVMNPRLNINASERVRSTVTENSVPRNVAFDVGLAISRTLDDMGLEFTLEAPEDMSVQNQLTAMTQEERGRVAVTMLVTGMYVTDDAETNGGYNYANTLNAYLQSAINEIAGKALSTVDVNFGIQSGTSEAGTNTTDYSFSFAKRFWGNRISVIVGGKVSTGRDAVNTGETIIDNVAIEYRLDKSASRYVNLFYDRNYESLLEGQVTKMGGGIVLRKKADRLGELFIFRNRKEEPAMKPEEVKVEESESRND